MRHNLALAVVASLALFACGGATTGEAKSADDAVWSDFKGTYSQPADPATRRLDKEEVAKKEAAPVAAPAAKAKEAPVEPTPAAEAPAPPSASASASAKKSSKGTVNGESLSSVSVDALTDASTSLTKSTLVSSGVVTGSKYEVVTVQTKKATIKVTRPATSPNPNGPDLMSPQTKSADVAKTDASWYDADADVLVVVSAKKKASAQKTLSAVIKH